MITKRYKKKHLIIKKILRFLYKHIKYDKQLIIPVFYYENKESLPTEYECASCGLECYRFVHKQYKASKHFSFKRGLTGVPYILEDYIVTKRLDTLSKD